MSNKNIRTACAVCGLTIGLEIDHVNENHFDNSAGNRMTLCKYHHMEKSRAGVESSKSHLQLIRTNPKMKRLERETAQRWFLEKSNEKSRGYQLELPIDRSE